MCGCGASVPPARALNGPESPTHAGEIRVLVKKGGPLFTARPSGFFFLDPLSQRERGSKVDYFVAATTFSSFGAPVLHAVHASPSAAAAVLLSDARITFASAGCWSAGAAAASALNAWFASPLPSFTVTVAVGRLASSDASFSCQNVSVYSPSGRPLVSISYVPSSLVTAKNGCSNTPMYALIHGCTSHLTRKYSAALGASGPSFLPGSLVG